MTDATRTRWTALALGSALGLLAVVGVLSLGFGPARVRAASPLYVRTDGDDDLCDGSVNAPYTPAAAPHCALATIQRGVYAVDPGGALFVATGVFTGPVWIDRDLALQGAGAANTILDGMEATQGLYIQYGTSVAIDDVTIRNCVDMFGGGIHSRGNLTLTNSIMARNHATSWGGAIYSTAVLVISNTTIVSNTAKDDGGGIHSNSELTITDSDIISNAGTDGGGIHHGWLTMTVVNSTIRGNRAFDYHAAGGGIFNDGEGVLINVTLTGNTATYTSTAEDGRGGAIHTQEIMTLTNCTVSGNTAGWGGAISNSSGQLTIASSTIAGNRVTTGSTGPGGISNYGTITATNTIIANNDKYNCGDTGVLDSAGHNLDSGSTCGFSAGGDLSNTDPSLAPLQDNGGRPTASGQAPQTLALLRGSPAIDAGSEVGCPAADQRGVARPVDGDFDGTALCDIGAFEFALGPALFDIYLPLTGRQF